MDITFDDSTLDAPQLDALVYFPKAIILADSQSRVTYMNPAAEQLLGLPLENARGHVLDKVLTLKERESRRPVPLFDYFSRNRPFDGAFHYLENSEGGLMPVQCSMSRARTDLGVAGGYIVSLRNANGLQHYIDKLVTQTMHDEHTRLLRRAELIKRLWRLLQENDSGDLHAFLYLDLDNFKAVNDRRGMRPAISRYARSLRASRLWCATGTPLHGWAAMSSACCWSTVRQNSRANVRSNCIGPWNPMP